MLRSLCCASLVLTIVLSICLLPQTVSARRCPVEEPETLLSLYQNSDSIYVAAFDKTTEGEIVESTEDYSVQRITKHFTISSTLKGENRKFVAINDQIYAYKTVAAEPEPAESGETTEPTSDAMPHDADIEEEEDGSAEELESGDTVLLFLRENGESEEGRPELTDGNDGIKKLSLEKMGVYEARINELNSIFAEKQVSGAKLLDWLIRCAVDPATRWEGTFELLQSVQAQEWRDQEAERRRERLASGLPVEEEAAVEEEDASEEEEPARKNFDTSVFARMIDAQQKQTLADLLLDPPGEDAKKGRVEVAGDRELVELVKRWGDPRLMGFLLDKLRVGSDDPELNSVRMSIVAEVLADSEATGIAERFAENAYYSDEDPVEDRPQSEIVGEEEVVIQKIEPEASPESEPEDEESVGRPDDAGTDTQKGKPVPKQTYKELRAAILQAFLARCDQVIAEKEKEKAEIERNNAGRSDNR